MSKSFKDEVIGPLSSIIKLLRERKKCQDMLYYRGNLNETCFENQNNNDPKYPTYELQLKLNKINSKINILKMVIGAAKWDYTMKCAAKQEKKNKFDLTGDIIGPFKVLRRVTREEEKEIERLDVPWDKFGMDRKEGRSLYKPKTRSSRWEVLDMRTGDRKIITKQRLKDQYMDKNLKGLVSGKLKVIGGPEIRKGKKMWLCKCICGRKVWKPDLGVRTKTSKICCRWCTSSEKAQERARIILERQVRSMALKDKWFDKEYKRLQGKPKELQGYVDKICADKALKLLEGDIDK